MPETLSLDDVRAMSSGSDADTRKYLSLADVDSMQEKAARDFLLKRETTDLAFGVRRSLRDAVNTGAELLASGWDKLTGSHEADRVRALNEAERQASMAGRPTTPGEMLGYVGGNTLAATPVLRAAGAGLSATGVPMLTRLGTAIESGGMSTGGPAGASTAARAGDMVLRSAGGAVNGYVSAGLSDPNSANTGAAVGAVLPPAIRAAQSGARAVTDAVRSARLPADVSAARDIASLAGTDVRDPAQVANLRNLLNQQGPDIIPGTPTVPEILQSPAVSQLQRTLKAVDPAPFVARDAEREAARRSVLERIAPIGPRSEVAQDVGNQIAEYAIPAHQAAQNRVRAAFDSVDPFNEARILLPLDQMEAANNQFLGRGTFGSGRGARQSLDTARDIGTIELPAVRAVPQAGNQPQTLEQAVRKLGGISPLSAGGMNKEIAELGQRQSGTTGLVSGKGRSIDQIAELMHERGFLSNPDPAELLDALRAGRSGRPVFGADVPDQAFRGRLDASMGDLPQAQSIPRPVNFNELQNLRSSITEKWAEAKRFGNAREAAALDAHRRAIDSTLEKLAAGRGAPDEFFAPDMVANYQEARGLHAAKEQRFRTGPQAAIFRQGGDGLPVAQGGEIPRRFFNGNASQVNDAQSFRRLVQNDPRLMGELHRYAVSDAAGQVDRFGNLTSAKFNRWMDTHLGAISNTFNDQQRAWLKAIAEDLRRADVAESLGRSTGSDTAQKAASMLRLGMVDSPAAQYLAGKIPFGRTILSAASSNARAQQAARLGGLLVDPPRMSGLLGDYIDSLTPRPAGLLNTNAVSPLLVRGAPLLLSGGGQ